MLEPDSLVRLLVVPAVAALGFSVVGECEAAASGRGPAAVFVALDRGDDCRRVCKAARDGFHADGRRPLVVGYGVGAAPLLTAHRVHGCADAVLMLAALAGRPCFVHLPTTDPVTAAGLTAREADVLVLLLSGLPTAAVAARLSISAHTARSHCRAVLRKFGVGDRATLRTTLLTGAADPSPAALGAALPRFA